MDTLTIRMALGFLMSHASDGVKPSSKGDTE